MQFTVPFGGIACPRPHFNLDTGRSSNVYLGHRYKEWRLKFDQWFEQWLDKTNYKLIEELTVMQPNRDGCTSPKINGKFRYDFLGYHCKAIFYIDPPKDIQRLVPLAANVFDLDNGIKSLLDGIFESQSFKDVGLNDRYVNSISAFRRYANYQQNSHAHIDVDLRLITLD